MLIINQWASEATGYITDEIKVKNEVVDGKPVACLYINGDCFAETEDTDTIDSLNQKLHLFVDKCKRTTDTFDIGAEISMIEENKSQLIHK